MTEKARRSANEDGEFDMEECKEEGHAAIACGKFFVSGPVGGGSLETGDDFTRRGVEELDSGGQTICFGRGSSIWRKGDTLTRSAPLAS